MIVDHWKNLRAYRAIHPLLDEAAAALDERDWLTIDDGRYELKGERLVAMAARTPQRPSATPQLEYHERYVDLQIVLAGEDRMGWAPRSVCRSPSVAYDAGRDVGFFADDPVCWLTLPAEYFAIFLPEDAHAPLAGTAAVHKVVFKLKVAG